MLVAGLTAVELAVSNLAKGIVGNYSRSEGSDIVHWCSDSVDDGSNNSENSLEREGGKVANGAKNGEDITDEKESRDGKDSTSSRDRDRNVSEMGERCRSESPLLSLSSSASHRPFAAFLVHLAVRKKSHW